VARNGLSPLQFTCEKRLLERTLGHIVFVTNEDTGATVKAGGREVISGFLHTPGTPNLVAVLLRKILLNDRECPYDLVKFVIQQRRTTTSLKGAACSFALENIAGKPGFQHLLIDFNPIYNNHTKQRYGFLQQLPTKKAIPRVANLTIVKFQQNGGLCFRYAWNNLATLQEKLRKLLSA